MTRDPLLLLACLVLAACSQADSSAPIRTDQQGYRFLGDELAIEAVYTNRTDSTVQVAYSGCAFPTFSLEKREEDGWVPAGAPVCPAVLYPPIPVEPGGSHRDTLRIHVEHFPAPDFPGTYRLVYEIRAATEEAGPFEEMLPTDARVSNAFEILR